MSYYTDSEITKLRREIERLRERLELYPVNISTGELDKSEILSQSCDGIACRDETIKLLEAKIERNRKEINGLIELLRKDRAEIERLRLEFYHYENENTYKGNSIRHWYNKAMAYGKGLDEANSEIERLRAERDRQYDQNCEQIVYIAKLEAVVDGLCDMLEEVGVDSHSALAALETDNG